jgi:hypothetical protein
MPRHVVCCEVLNLQKQVGFLPNNFALAEAYRVTAAETESLEKGVGTKRQKPHHEHSRVTLFIPRFYFIV